MLPSNCVDANWAADSYDWFRAQLMPVSSQETWKGCFCQLDLPPLLEALHLSGYECIPMANWNWKVTGSCILLKRVPIFGQTMRNCSTQRDNHHMQPFSTALNQAILKVLCSHYLRGCHAMFRRVHPERLVCFVALFSATSPKVPRCLGPLQYSFLR